MDNTSAHHVRWDDVPAEQLNPLLQRQFISGENITVSYIRLKQGCLVPTHSHESEQVAVIVSGALRFVLGPEGAAREFIVRANEAVIIPPNVPHSAEALEDTFNLDIFSPRREDWISGADAYLR